MVVSSLLGIEAQATFFTLEGLGQVSEPGMDGDFVFTLQVISPPSPKLSRIVRWVHPLLALGQLHAAGQEQLRQGAGRSWQPLCSSQQSVQAA